MCVFEPLWSSLLFCVGTSILFWMKKEKLGRDMKKTMMQRWFVFLRLSILITLFDSKETTTVVNGDMRKWRKEGKWDLWWWEERKRWGCCSDENGESLQTWFWDYLYALLFCLFVSMYCVMSKKINCILFSLIMITTRNKI